MFEEQTNNEVGDFLYLLEWENPLKEGLGLAKRIIFKVIEIEDFPVYSVQKTVQDLANLDGVFQVQK